MQDVLILLLNADIAGAERRLALERGDILDVEDVSDADILKIKDGDEIRRIPVGSAEHAQWLGDFAKNAKYLEWMLFMHPEQEAVVNEDFSGPAQLSGVSGSGKTCVAVRRALRLATQNSDAKILIVTLNKSLSGLINILVSQASSNANINNQIDVRSFFSLCQDLLRQFEPENQILYNDITLKLDEHFDEVFREFYRCWHNSDNAKTLLPVHISLTSRGVSAETYLREEFDWIRSALTLKTRDKYGSLDRIGRKYPLQEKWRNRIIKGLEAWEQKMRAVGVIDYLGLTTEVTKHIDEIKPKYDHIIIDEAQDFGTLELAIIRKLSEERQNDIFLCGDIAQHVLPKHRQLPESGISIAGRSRRIRRNYRNSREILKAAYAVLIANLSEEIIDSADFEILDPEFANRSSPQPCVLAAQNLAEEFAFARTLVRDHLESEPEDKCCISFAGYSLREVQRFSLRVEMPVLDGLGNFNDNTVVLSDLEQTKGYEFNLMVVLNCLQGILPPLDMPEEEAFRSACRLYVTMTRARDELYLSYHDIVSPWLKITGSNLTFMEWPEVVHLDDKFLIDEPVHLSEIEYGHDNDVLGLDGRQFIYSRFARGLSTDALLKIDELVDGRGLRSDGVQIKWRTMESLRRDLETYHQARRLFGPRIQEEVRNVLSKIYT